MKAIIIIRTDVVARYEITRDDLTRQMKERGWDLPVFVLLQPIDGYEDIDIVWIDEKMEQEKFTQIIEQHKNPLGPAYEIT